MKELEAALLELEQTDPDSLVDVFNEESCIIEYEGPISILSVSVEDMWAVEAVRLDGLIEDDDPWNAPTLEEMLLERLGLERGLYGEIADNKVRIRIERID